MKTIKTESKELRRVIYKTIDVGKFDTLKGHGYDLTRSPILYFLRVFLEERNG